jgi:hypothetical protein
LQSIGNGIIAQFYRRWYGSDIVATITFGDGLGSNLEAMAFLRDAGISSTSFFVSDFARRIIFIVLNRNENTAISPTTQSTRLLKQADYGFAKLGRHQNCRAGQNSSRCHLFAELPL